MDLSLDRFALRRLGNYGVPVFLFHKVPEAYDPLVPQELIRTQFEETLDFITENFRVIPLADLVASLKGNALPRQSACLTFDDGYAQWRDVLVPILHQRGIPATFFITTGQFSGIPMWHERVTHAVRNAPSGKFFIPGFGLPEFSLNTLLERSQARDHIEHFLKYLPLDTREELLLSLESYAGVDKVAVEVMPDEDIRHIHSLGFEIGAHTRLHPILALSSEDEALDEVGQAREWLSGVINAPVHAFAYPNGKPGTDFHASHVEIVRKSGYQYAVTTAMGRASSSTPIFQIPRFTPWGPTRKAMGYQLARNLATHPPILSEQPTSNTLRRVLYVENGAGFGGAVVALRVLLRAMATSSQESHVVSNLPVVDFSAVQGVRSHSVIPDSVFNSRAWAAKVHPLKPTVLRRLLLFCIGRLDDLCNRLPYLLRLIWRMHVLRPDVVHGNNEPSSNREAMLAAKLLRIPYVQHLRGAIAQSKQTPWILKRPDLFIPVSRWLSGELQMAGVPNDRIRQIYDAIDVSDKLPDAISARKQLQRQLEVSKNAIVVAMIGMLIEWKGQHHFIEAVEKIAAAHTDAVFLIIGGVPEKSDGTYARQLDAMVRMSGLKDRLHMLGRRNDLPDLISGIDIVVSASTEPEPLGLVMLEALQAGKLFVGPGFGAATEIVRDGVDGFLFDPGSPASLATKLEQAICATRNAVHKERSPWQGAKRFSPEVQVAELNSVYLRLNPSRQ